MSDETFHALVDPLLEEVMTKTYQAIEQLLPDAIAVGCGLRVTNVSTATELAYTVQIEPCVPVGEVDWRHW